MCLLEKLQKIHLNEYLLRWMFNYLHGCSQCVRVNDLCKVSSHSWRASRFCIGPFVI